MKTERYRLTTLGRALTITLVGLLWPAFCWAQQPREVLQQVEQRLKNGGGVEVKFGFSDTQAGNHAGTLALQGEMFRLRTEEMTVWFDGKTQWTYQEASEEVWVTTPTAEELQGIHPFAWLSLYRSGYRISMKEQTAARWVVELKTAQPRAEVSSLQLTIRRSDYALQHVVLKRRGGETTEIVVNSQQSQPLWPHSYFRFNPKEYPRAEVVDMRN